MKHDDPRAGSDLPAPDSASPRLRGSVLDVVQGATEPSAGIEHLRQFDMRVDSLFGIDLNGLSQ